MAVTTVDGVPAAPSWLRGCKIVDTSTGLVTAPATVELREGSIWRIGFEEPPPQAVDVLDLSGTYLLPGMVSCHTHLQATYPYSQRDPDEPPARTALRAAGMAETLLAAGVTSVRCVHEQNRADIHVRFACRSGWTAAPEIAAAGRALTRRGGHGDGLGCVVASGYEGFLAAARGELAAGADHIKIYSSGGLARDGETVDSLELSDDEVSGAVQAAEDRGTYVVSHAASSPSIQQGLRLGVRSFEHGYELDSETASKMAQDDVYFTPTLCVTHVSDWMEASGFEPSARERARRAGDGHLESVRRAYTAGVKIVIGTDFPASAMSAGTTIIVRELELLVEAGMTPLETLRAATINGAQLIRRAREIGKVEVGYRADLIAVDSDPTQSVSALRRISFVMQGGQVIGAA